MYRLRVRQRVLKGGFNYTGTKQRPLFVSKSATDNHTEHQHQAAFFDWLRWNEKAHPVLTRFFAIPNGGHRTKTTAAKLKAEGVRPGVLDTCLPVARHGYIGLWLEFKSATGSLSPAQREWKSFLESEGHKVIIVRTWTEAARATVEYLSLSVHTPIPRS